MTDYPNVPPTVGAVLSSGLATLTELSGTLGVEDMYDLLEVATVDSYNRAAAERYSASRSN